MYSQGCFLCGFFLFVGPKPRHALWNISGKFDNVYVFLVVSFHCGTDWLVVFVHNNPVMPY